MPRWDSFLSMVINSIKASGWINGVIERFEARLLPLNQGGLRREVKESTRAVLSREFKPYELHKFFATLESCSEYTVGKSTS